MAAHIILQDFKGSPDGITVVDYIADDDDEVELSDSLAEVAVREGWARPVREEGDAVAPKPRGPGNQKGKGK